MTTVLVTGANRGLGLEFVRQYLAEAEAKDVIVVVLNPGWVKTDMGGDAATLSTEESIGSLRTRIAALSIEDSGTFIDHDGRQIPW